MDLNKYKCPSCNVIPDITKSSSLRYGHLKDCKIGRLNPEKGSLGISSGETFICNNCNTKFTMKLVYPEKCEVYLTQCQICWKIAEAI